MTPFLHNLLAPFRGGWLNLIDRDPWQTDMNPLISMELTPDHWCAEAIRELLPGGREMPVRRFGVIHFTAGATARSSIGFWRTPEAKGAGAHVVIDRDGTIYQCRPFDRTAGHAGVSKWHDGRKSYEGLNSCAIGIELANAGDSYPALKRFSELPPVLARHKHGGPLCEWEAFPEAQYNACEALSRALVARYRLDDVIGHDDIAPQRKADPGPAFPMGRLRLACGFPEGIA